MARARVSARYRIVIPKDIRAELDIRPGQEFEVLVKGGVISFVPDRPIAAMRGFLRGIRTSGFREK
jgi:AbrB family looped-hinge helix DNA binding protein